MRLSSKNRPKTARSRLGIETLEARAMPAIVTWDGGALLSNDWTARFNWVGNQAPQPGDDLVFPNGGDRLTTNFNDFPPGTGFHSITFTGGGYKLNGNRIGVATFSPFNPGGVTNSAGNNTIALPLEISAIGALGGPAGPVSVSVEAGSTLTISGAISGSGFNPATLRKTNFGTLVLTGSNTFPGTMNIEQGVVRAGSNSALGGSAGPTHVLAGATLELPIVDLNNELVTLTGTGFGGQGALHATGLSSLSASGTSTTVLLDADARIKVDAGSGLTIENLGGPTVGSVTVAPELEKDGDGILALTGGNTQSVMDYLVNDGGLEFIGNYPNGSLLIDPPGSGTAEVSGIGTAPGATIAAGGRVNPGATLNGAPTGRLTFDGNTTFGQGAIVNLQITNSATFFDRIRVNGTVGLTGSILRLNSGTTPQFPAFNTPFVILENDGNEPVQGFLSDEIPGQLPVIGEIGDESTFVDDVGRPWRINYQGGDGNDVAITYLGIAPMFTNRQLLALSDTRGTARLTGTIVEPEPGDRFILEIDWNDGTARQKYNFPPGSDGTAIDITHRYRTPGTYTVSLFWHDEHGLGSTATLGVTIPF